MTDEPTSDSALDGGTRKLIVKTSEQPTRNMSSDATTKANGHHSGVLVRVHKSSSNKIEKRIKVEEIANHIATALAATADSREDNNQADGEKLEANQSERVHEDTVEMRRLQMELQSQLESERQSRESRNSGRNPLEDVTKVDMINFAQQLIDNQTTMKQDRTDKLCNQTQTLRARRVKKKKHRAVCILL